MGEKKLYRHNRAEVFKTSDGAELIGQFFFPTGAAKAILLINCATGVPQSFYWAFAEYAAREHQLIVFTFDYRDMGRSAKGALRASKATMAQWGLQDQTAARRFVKDRYPELSLWVLGHSLGGMTLPLQADIHEIDRVICVASGAVHHRDHPWPYRMFALLFWFGFGPVLTSLLGFLPGRMLGLGADLPAGVYWQWRRWCTHAGTFGGEEGESLPEVNWDAPKTPVTMIAFSDDEVIPPHCVVRLAQNYQVEEKDVRVISPASVGLSEIGHIAAFSRRNKAVWERLLISE
jgi:predicted alpha/beta hydrolase